jgi:hypothetical protein
MLVKQLDSLGVMMLVPFLDRLSELISRAA